VWHGMVDRIGYTLTELGRTRAILLVKQDVSLAMSIATEAHVLDQGRIVLRGKAADVARDPALYRFIAVNQTGTLLGMRAAIPAMLRRGGGSIVDISSIYGLVAASASPAYQASKAAIRMLSRAAALEFADQGIRVNIVMPGLVETAMVAGILPERRETRLRRTPMGRIASPMEIAQGVLFLASDEASFVTGAELVMDGGYTAS